MTTPIRSALQPKGELVACVKKGLGALKKGDAAYIDKAVRETFGDSLDLDEAMRVGHEEENRWDYLLGFTPSAELIALEPHLAKGDQISTVIAKRKAALVQLRGHLRSGVQVRDWLWVASGNVAFADTEKVRVRLDQNGIRFVGRMVLEKHLPGAKLSLRASRRRSGRVNR